MAAVMVTAPPLETQPMLPRPRLVVVAAPPPAVFRRRRLAVVGVLLAVFVLATLVVGRVARLGDTPAGPQPRPGPTSYVVQPGDTLWSIARSLQPIGDVRPVVHGLLDANDGVASLSVGQVLMVP